ncbi:PQQ-binding-like beta-propeller repeat protein [Massilia sp. PAMC28688]|uniref:pilus assembly protein n=1 Tax=Massilia sp. PAMC28688 TaxID=2861283 RepID=UPI001C638B52|nr:PilC/PilY family type IV pilus protein [Massilia sp. PAMC28688]QYF92872.1 PQQ-binding-like beta-propeller repeat protein [Massilia sp. PAMC28688]
MKPLLPLLAGLLLAQGAQAGPTEIAQSPLLNITGGGLVRPNLMILYDNSGSMARNFTPDYVGTGVCRSSSTLAGGTRTCKAGDPPFSSADFNKQYYNPNTWYKPPVKADGTFYASMTSSATSGWTVVPTDGFGINKVDLRDDTFTNSNLATSFPDFKWCNGSSTTDCMVNTVTYSYPNATYRTAREIVGNPYYYTINAAESCTDATLKTCIPLKIGATPPSSHPFLAKVRFCTDRNLTDCQAKNLDTHPWPRFSNASSGAVSHGLLEINSLSGTGSRSISSVSVSGVTITDTGVTSSNGLNTVDKVRAFTSALARSIINKNGLTAPYTACVRTPTLSSVPACAGFGIVVPDGTIAVVPVTCAPNSTSKEIGEVCNFVLDDSRAGNQITVSTGNVSYNTVAIAAGNVVFNRVDLTPSRTQYPRGTKRGDCAAGTHCTYAEEMTNFANWYTYYRTRNQMMKTAVGMAFDPIGGNYNVGLVSLSTAAANGTMNTPKKFIESARSAWYTQLYAMNGNSFTPTRAALHAIGTMYANQGNYVKPAGSEVVQFACQQNFTFVTSDGYWNGAGATSEVTNNDSTEDPARFCTQASGCVQPAAEGVSLADIALHWYNGGSSTSTESLRPDLEGPVGRVPSLPGGNKRLHMSTYTLGLGVDGLMTYEPEYKDRPSPTGDFIKVLNRVPTGCPWNDNKEWVWPDPKVSVTSGDPQSRVDDLWHAAVNGRGRYFSAAEPDEVVEGVTRALLNIESSIGAAAAAATSTPNISLQDNDIFSDTFTTVKWFGELTNRRLDPLTGEIIPQVRWNSSNTVGQKVASASDTRVIKMLDTSAGAAANKLKDFKFSAMTNAEKAWFTGKCSTMLQCDDMSPAQRTLVDGGSALVDWLRGQQQYADDIVFRQYSTVPVAPGEPPGLPIVLGDIASSKPAFMRRPRLNYDDDDYKLFKQAHAGRQATVFVGANDGMLHAFDAATGNELWAYAPRITMKKLYKQASTTYGGNHQYSVDGSPAIWDVKIGLAWRTVLVSGLNGGGRGYFALDVTDPANPKALWELCADPAVCSGINLEPELGLTFGNPQFGLRNGKWVVYLTSGYNNIPGTDGVPGGTGNGFLFIVDVATGEVLSKTPTMHNNVAAGNVTTPSGFAKISAVNSNPNADPIITEIYGGDNLGNMWRFNVNGPSVTVRRMGSSGVDQPITTRPEVTACVVPTSQNGVERIVTFGTGRLLDVPDLASEKVQAIYTIKDSASNLNLTGATMVQRKLKAIVAGGTNYMVEEADVDLASKSGWYMKLDKNLRERVNLDPRVIADSLTAVTNIPGTSSSCTVGGSSNIYRLNVCTGGALNQSTTTLIKDANGVEQSVAGEVLSDNAAAVGFIVVQLPNGALKIVTTTADGGTRTDTGPVTQSHGSRKSGWRRVDD